jgi:hypothetical protein
VVEPQGLKSPIFLGWFRHDLKSCPDERKQGEAMPGANENSGRVTFTVWRRGSKAAHARTACGHLGNVSSVEIEEQRDSSLRRLRSE